ncbi:MAG: winged helix-turn-helix domain-containing protein [Clostridiales bacterium]|nr:winged helix-turn-helix domain-containing protein [Clostridiales bacterium]
MKKNIEFINMDFSTLSYLKEKLKAAPSSVKCAEELLSALSALEKGASESIMLQLGETELSQAQSEIVCGELHIFPLTRRVQRGRTEIILTPKEFDILLFLAKNRGEVFTKEQIYKAVWDAEYLMDDSNIMAFIRKLRKKIEPHPDSPEYIITIWGIGYKFNDSF